MSDDTTTVHMLVTVEQRDWTTYHFAQKLRDAVRTRIGKALGDMGAIKVEVRDITAERARLLTQLQQADND